MTFRRWDIVFIRVDEKDTTGHPAVVLSPDDLMAEGKQLRFNVVTGTKKQPAESARNHHVSLDEVAKVRTPRATDTWQPIPGFPGMVRFEARLPHRFGDVGEVDGVGLWGDGGWYPQPVDGDGHVFTGGWTVQVRGPGTIVLNGTSPSLM